MSTYEDELMDAKGVNSMGECPTCGYVECSCQSDSGFDETKWCVNDVVYAISEHELDNEFVIKINDGGLLPGEKRRFTLVDSNGQPCSPLCGYMEIQSNGDGKHIPWRLN